MDSGPPAQASAWTYPAAPANLAAAPGDKLVSLTWDDPSNSSIVRYEYQRKTVGDWSDTWTAIPGSGTTTTQYVAEGLVNGTAYTFRLRAVSAGNGTTSAEVTASPQASPAMPTDVSASAVGVSTTTVTWSYGNVALIEKFQVRYRAGNEAWSAWTDVATSSRSYAATSSLAYGTVYTFEIRGVNDQSVAGPAAQGRTATAPGAPTGLTATPGAQQATLRWDDPAYASITGWEYRQTDPKGGLAAFAGDGEVDLFWRSLASTTAIAKWQYSSDDGANWTDVPDSASTTTSYVVPSLTNATVYTFRVRALNASSTPVAGTEMGNPSATPTATVWTAIADSGATTTAHTVTGLVDYAVYAFQLRAVNPAGDGLASAPVEATPRAVTAFTPTGLTVTPGDRQVTLRWTNPGGAVTGNSYRYKPASSTHSGYTEWVDVGVVATSTEVTGLTAGVRYTFQVRSHSVVDCRPSRPRRLRGRTRPRPRTWRRPPGTGSSP